jgi:hypothetical protein
MKSRQRPALNPAAISELRPEESMPPGMPAVSARRPGYSEQLRTPRYAAEFLCVSDSWLAKARMRGDGPAFVKVGRAIRYQEKALVDWTRSRQRLSTSER